MDTTGFEVFGNPEAIERVDCIAQRRIVRHHRRDGDEEYDVYVPYELYYTEDTARLLYAEPETPEGYPSEDELIESLVTRLAELKTLRPVSFEELGSTPYHHFWAP